ncbi:MAG: hypothetical protein JZU52_12750, partial [Lamprocystis purpurea]|nr:hypothetical protein [Lamprocystis purpurea]
MGIPSRLLALASGIANLNQCAALTSSGSYTVPAGVTRLILTLVGGGAGGQGRFSAPTNQGGGGGAGATIHRMFFPVTPGQVIGYVIGAGGAAGTLAAAPT